jgi:ribonuclease D
VSTEPVPAAPEPDLAATAAALADAVVEDEAVEQPTLPTLQLSAPVRPRSRPQPSSASCCTRFRTADGPVAIDAERASGYRYGQRAYLVQLRREGAGTWLIDPLGLPDLTALNDEIGRHEWVLHAASQDIPCLAEIGLRPQRIFDTELGARLAGYERVGLAAMVETVLGYNLEKGHSSADWSTRPAP